MEPVRGPKEINQSSAHSSNEIEWATPELPETQGKENREAKVELPTDPKVIALVLRGIHGKK